MPKQLIQIKDLAKLRVVGDPQMSPDGTRVIFTVKDSDIDKNKYATHLWMYSIHTHATTQFTFGDSTETSPRWSRDGRHIAFLRNKDKRTQIWRVDANGGEACLVTKLPEGSISEIRWSPDGSKIAFAFRPAHQDWTRDAAKKREESGKSNPPRVITRPRYRTDGIGFVDERTHIWFCDARTGEPKQVTTGDLNDTSPAWSADGKTLAFVSNRNADREWFPQRADIYLISTNGGAPKKIRSTVGPKSALNFSPDGKSLAYVGYELGEFPFKPHNDRVFVVPKNGGKARCITAQLDRTVGNQTLADSREAAEAHPIWSRDSNRVFVTVSDTGNVHLYSVDVKSGRMSPLTRGAMDISGASADAASRHFALAIGNAVEPVELFIGTLDANGLRTRRVTEFNRGWIKEKSLCTPEEFWLTQPDGARIQGWVLRPPNARRGKKYPMLLYVHGGPHGQYGSAFFHEMQVHAARGYVVVMGNPRGSNGRDEKFGAAIYRDFGNLDYLDVMALADYGIALPYVDPARTAIAGGSYGGFMANWVAGHTPRFQCAVTDRSICNWMMQSAISDIISPAEGRWPGNIWNNTEEMWRMSPLKYAANVRTPMLIIHSEGDLRCPIVQGETWFVALKRLGVKTVFVRYPRETSHGMSRGGPLDLRIDRLTRIAAWLDEHLRKQ